MSELHVPKDVLYVVYYLELIQVKRVSNCNIDNSKTPHTSYFEVLMPI